MTESTLPEPFVYEKFTDAENQIRLLQLHVGQDGHLECTLEHFPLDERRSKHVEYTAVSYTWGSLQPTKFITVNNHSFPVTENCHYALTQVAAQHSREHKKYFWIDGHCIDPVKHPRHIWIDSICINQADLEEKSAQVQKMAGVYRIAQAVYACVGQHANGSRELLCSLNAWSSVHITGPHIPPLSEDHPGVIGSPWDWLDECISKQWTLCGSEKSFDEYHFNWVSTFIAFGNRDYWSRVWIVPETHGAWRLLILCGDDRIETPVFKCLWTHFSRTTCTGRQRLWPRLWDHTSMLTVLRGTQYDPQVQFAWNSDTKRGMEALPALKRYASFKCADPRDRVYALGHLMEWPGYTYSPRPNYSCTAMELLAALMERLTPAIMDEIDIDYPEEFFYHYCDLAKTLQLTPASPEVAKLRQKKARVFKANRQHDESTEHFTIPHVNGSAFSAWLLHAHADGSLYVDAGAAYGNDHLSYGVSWKYYEPLVPQVEACSTGLTLRSGTSIIGRVCEGTISGDLLLRPHAWGTERYNPYWLILRRYSWDHQKQYRLIGYAFVYQHTEDFSCGQSSYHQLHFDQEDLLLYCTLPSFDGGQDITTEDLNQILAICPTRSATSSYSIELDSRA